MENPMMKKVGENNYFLKSGYQSRMNPEYFYDWSTGDVNWQPQVYALAGYLGRSLKCTSIIDLGCGSAKKLVALYPEFEILGVDIGYNLQYCKDTYSYGNWFEHDLESSEALNIPEKYVENSIIICADVIEHLVDPTLLLMKIKRLMDFSPVCLLTTPERDLVRGTHDFGPPANISHVREWNTAEFTDLLSSFQFDVKFTGLTLSNDLEREKHTILAILGSNNGTHERTKALDKMDVKANIMNII